MHEKATHDMWVAWWTVAARRVKAMGHVGVANM